MWCATDGALWVIFDNTSLIARLDPPGAGPARKPGASPARLGTDYEDIAHDRVDGTYYVLVETVG